MILQANRKNESYDGVKITKTVRGLEMSDCGAFRSDEKILFALTLPRTLGASGAVLRIVKDKCENEEDIVLSCERSEIDGEIYSAEISLGTGLYFYEILILRGLETLFSYTENNYDYTFKSRSEGRFSLLIYDADYIPMKRERMMYHVFVDRFNKSESFDLPRRNDAVYEEDWHNGKMQYAKTKGGFVRNNQFFGGSLYGVTEKLDYLASLGVSVIYLSPIFKAYSNHKYDTGDYLRVDEGFGGDEALKELIEKAREKNISIILDGVFNHTGDDSIYFNKKEKYRSLGAYNSKESEYYDWFNFREYPSDYESWWGIPILPRLKLKNKKCRDFITQKVCKKYMEMGIGGFRLDVADELCDEFLYEFRSELRKYSKNAALIGEVWENAVLKESYGDRRHYFEGRQLDSVMNYPFRASAIEFFKYADSEIIADTLKALWATYPREVCHSLMNIIGTHDTERILTVLGNADCTLTDNVKADNFRLSPEAKEEALERLKALSTLQYTVYGFPCLYYGDEAEMEGLHDPFCRRPFPWGRENKDLTEHYKRLGALREDRVFTDGDFAVLCAKGGLLVFERKTNEKRAVVAINASSRKVKLGKTYKGYDLYNKENTEISSLPPYGFAVVEINK